MINVILDLVFLKQFYGDYEGQMCFFQGISIGIGKGSVWYMGKYCEDG